MSSQQTHPSIRLIVCRIKRLTKDFYTLHGLSF
jgi:hypothetical protein